MISATHKCIYIHIPRTAGRSVSNALGARGKIAGKHFFARRILAEVGDYEWKQYFTFSIVRNPWDRAVSLFFQQTGNLPDCKPDFRQWIIDQVSDNGYPNDNSRFWECSLVDGGSTGGTSTKWKCQTDWLLGFDDKIAVDYVARFENLAFDWKDICEIIGVKYQPLAFENPTEHNHYSYYYDDETRQIVADWHRRDIENWGYEFKGSGKIASSLLLF